MKTNCVNLLGLLDELRKSESFKCRVYESGEWQTRTGSDVARDVDVAISRLRACGVTPGHRVGICASNSYNWVVYDLALISLRCMSVVFPETAQHDWESLGATWNLALVLLSRRDPPANSVPTWVLYIDDAANDVSRIRAAAAITTSDPEFVTPTYVFSSGTTGRLKCLSVSRFGIEHLCQIFASAYHVGAHDSILMFLPLSNLQQRLMVYGAIGIGATMILAGPAMLFRALKDESPTIMIAPPLFYETIERRFNELPGWKRISVTILAALICALPRNWGRHLRKGLFRTIHESLGGRTRVLISGMAHIRLSTLVFFERIGLPIFEVYSLTESGLVSGNRPGERRLGSVGRPFEERSVEVAEDGEIVIRRNALLATDYPNDPEGARAVFPFPGIVRTGDIGRFDKDGYLYLTGRKKDIIVTAGGYKVHPEIIEEQLMQLDNVLNCAVFGSEREASLWVVIALKQDTPRDARERIEHLVTRMNSRLPQGCQLGRVVFAHPFTIESGLLTRNLKPNRPAIQAAYAMS